MMISLLLVMSPFLLLSHFVFVCVASCFVTHWVDADFHLVATMLGVITTISHCQSLVYNYLAIKVLICRRDWGLFSESDSDFENHVIFSIQLWKKDGRFKNELTLMWPVLQRALRVCQSIDQYKNDIEYIEALMLQVRRAQLAENQLIEVRAANSINRQRAQDNKTQMRKVEGELAAYKEAVPNIISEPLEISCEEEYTENEFRKMIGQEDLYREYKSLRFVKDNDVPKKFYDIAVRTILGAANIVSLKVDDEGNFCPTRVILYGGIEDDGSTTGMPIKMAKQADTVHTRLTNILSQTIPRPPDFEITYIKIDGNKIVMKISILTQKATGGESIKYYLPGKRSKNGEEVEYNCRTNSGTQTMKIMANIERPLSKLTNPKISNEQTSPVPGDGDLVCCFFQLVSKEEKEKVSK